MPLGPQGQRYYVGDGSQVATDYQSWLETTQKQKIDLAKSAVATKAQLKAIRFVVVGDFYITMTSCIDDLCFTVL